MFRQAGRQAILCTVRLCGFMRAECTPALGRKSGVHRHHTGDLTCCGDMYVYIEALEN